MIANGLRQIFPRICDSYSRKEAEDDRICDTKAGQTLALVQAKIGNDRADVESAVQHALKKEIADLRPCVCFSP